MKTILFIMMHLLIYNTTFAKKKIIKQAHLNILKASVANEDNAMSKNGDVYQFTITSNVNNITIDSILFKIRPVPVDAYELVKNKRITTINKNDTVLVTCAKDYYKIIMDTKKVKPAKPFAGEAKIYYLLNGKRYYYIVQKVERTVSKRKTR
jgi:hypothetical protein